MNKSASNNLFEKTRFVDKLKIHRLLNQNGHLNIFQQSQRHRLTTFLLFTKLVDSSWSWILIIFFLILVISWLGFALVWYLICYAHGDFEVLHLPSQQTESDFTPCIYHIHNFGSCLLFSIETQHTVGYGIKATTDECPEAIFVNAIQCIFGFILQGFMAVIIFTKMTTLRNATLRFSKRALICEENHKLSLVFRIGDVMRKNHIIDTKIRAFYISHQPQSTSEGDFLHYQQIELKLSFDKTQTLFFCWPLTISHEINVFSPLYHLNAANLKECKFEILVVLEGTSECTGQMTQAKTSFISNEILWGMKFVPIMTFDGDRREFQIDFTKFDEIQTVSMSFYSAASTQDCNLLQIGDYGSYSGLLFK